MSARHAGVLALVALGASCATPSGSGDGPEVLVTFPVVQFDAARRGGSQRAYHGSDWDVPLHTRAVVRKFARDHALIERDAWPIEPLGVYCVTFAAPGHVHLAALMDSLDRDPRAALVQPNQTFHGMITAREDEAAYDDPLIDAQYGAYRTELEALHALSRGENVKLGVIDSNVDAEHPDLEGQIAKQVELVHASSKTDRVHGTAVTGVIGAAAANGEGVVGLAPAAAIYVYGACHKSGAGTVCNSLTLAKALTHAIDDRLDVLNFSLAGPHDPLLAALFERVMADGTIVVAADDPEVGDRRFPASLPNVLAARTNQRQWFARAEQLSTRSGGGYQVFYGASIAAAGLAGFTAVVRARHSTADTRRIVTRTDECRLSESDPTREAAFTAARCD
jgi:subtilisin family serine protease